MGLFKSNKREYEDSIDNKVAEEQIEETQENVEKTEEEMTTTFSAEAEIDKLIVKVGGVVKMERSGKDSPQTRDDYIKFAIENTIDYFTVTYPETLNLYETNKITLESTQAIIKKYIAQNIYMKEFGTLSKEEVEEVYKGFERFIWGYDVIDELIEDTDISDIAVVDGGTIMIKENGRRKKSDVTFRNIQSYERFVEHVALKNRRSISEMDALQWFVDSKTSDKFRLRFTISTGVVTSSGLPYISVRKIPKFKRGKQYYIDRGFMTEDMYKYLVSRVRDGHGLNICGKGGEGKTLLMNEIIDNLPEDKRYSCIQDNEELFTNTHENIMFHKTVEPQGESKVKYLMSELLKHGLVADLDGYIVGEVKGREAAVLAHASYTGHQCLCTSHAKSAKESLYKIADYAREESGEELDAYLPKVCSIDTVVFIKGFKIAEVVEVIGFDRKKKEIIYRDIDVEKGCVKNAKPVH